MEIYKRLKKLAEKKKLTTEDREFIVGLCADNGIVINTLCKDCYNDAVLQLYSIYKPQDEAKENTHAKYVLRDGLNVRFNGRIINAATITDELAARIIAQGFPTRLFKKLPKE